MFSKLSVHVFRICEREKYYTSCRRCTTTHVRSACICDGIHNFTGNFFFYECQLYPPTGYFYGTLGAYHARIKNLWAHTFYRNLQCSVNNRCIPSCKFIIIYYYRFCSINSAGTRAFNRVYASRAFSFERVHVIISECQNWSFLVNSGTRDIRFYSDLTMYSRVVSR